MSKPLCIVSCPIDTYSGYGARSRDFVDSLIESRPDWEVKILPQPWGNTRWGYLVDHDRQDLISKKITSISQKPEVWIQITIPNEFKRIGEFNVGVTAGIETTLCAPEWIQGINEMDLVLTSSIFAKDTFQKVSYELKTGEILKVKKPIEVLFEGVNPSLYRSLKASEVSLDLVGFEESFAFLLVGAWLSGSRGYDRKNIANTIKVFLETFKNKPNPPALLVKTQRATSSIMDKYLILDKINAIRDSMKASSLPNIYLLHGDLSDAEMNELYNHPKVKALVSLTRGEGFGRPLLEFSTTGKPIFASGWSGHLDFLHKEKTTLIPGVLEEIHPSNVDGKTFVKYAKWFSPDEKFFSSKLKEFVKNPKPFNRAATSQKAYVLKNFTTEHMTSLLQKILEEHSPDFPKPVELKLPETTLSKLTKI